MIRQELINEANEQLEEHGQISTQLAEDIVICAIANTGWNDKVSIDPKILEAIFNAGKPANTRSYHEE